MTESASVRISGVTDESHSASHTYAISQLSQSWVQCRIHITVDMVDIPAIWYVPKYHSLVLSMVGYLELHWEVAGSILEVAGMHFYVPIPRQDIYKRIFGSLDFSNRGKRASACKLSAHKRKE